MSLGLSISSICRTFSLISYFTLGITKSSKSYFGSL